MKNLSFEPFAKVRVRNAMQPRKNSKNTALGLTGTSRSCTLKAEER